MTAMPSGRLAQGAYADSVAADAERFAAAVRTGPLDAPVSGCPGWDLRTLTDHMGYIHRWAGHAAAHGERPADTADFHAVADTTADQLSAWLLDGATALTTVLRRLDPTTPTWHPFLVERLAGVWPRRQAHETSIHRWDAEHAVGPTAPIDAVLASDGIDEFFEVTHPRALTRERATPPVGSLHVHYTDTAGEWIARYDDTGYHFTRRARQGRRRCGPGRAAPCWRSTRDHDADALSPVGDPAVLAAWLDAPGL